MNIDEVITRIGQENLDEFLDFMKGQTVGIKDDLIDYYEYDVEQFMDVQREHPWD